ncbi:hypothetical protein O3M35_011613 [Rhynocoris fuscipes]|uniref:DUF389 domain-containing protein n=1 Tax=Rhynocoris fuscipes TaxID=488301 RepID=A0AAW1CVW1_9HEMI
MSYTQISVTVPINNDLKIIKNKENSVPIKTLEFLIKDLENDLQILYPIWFTDSDNHFKQVSFFIKNDKNSEEIIAKLKEQGFGVDQNSAIRILSPCKLIYETVEKLEEDADESNLEEISPKSNSASWEKFIHSLDPFVAEVFQSVRRQAVLTWDFNILLFVAALTASLGLIENSTVTLVASMLISPMMGPVMAVLFGTLTRTRKLQKLGIFNCLLTVILCILIGFLFGCALLTVQINWPIEDLPTYEMTSRGEVRSLWVGLLIAFLAGIAITTATLNDRWQDSIMGVAISVAILPPAVNAGLLWSMAIFNYLYKEGTEFPQNYKAKWSQQPGVEYASLGGISLCLTFINVIAIFLGGALVLKVKNFRLRKVQHLTWSNLGKDQRNFDDEDNKCGVDKSAGDYFFDFPSKNNRWSFSQCLPNTSEISYRNLHTWTPGGNNWAIEGKPSALDIAVRIAQERRIAGSIRGYRLQADSMAAVSETSNETQATRFNVTQTPEDFCNDVIPNHEFLSINNGK